MSSHKQIYQTFLFYFSMLGLVVSVLVGFYDVIFGSILEFCHLIFEIVEMGLDKLVEHTLHTNSRDTELIVFYILAAIIALLIYLVWKALVLIAASFSNRLSQDWVLLKEAAAADWEAMTITNKIIWVSAFLLLNYLVSFLFF